MKGMEWTGEALLTDLDLRPLRCLVCGCQAEGNTMRVTRVEDGCWLAICDDCCEFFGEVPHDFCGGRRAPGGAPSGSTTPPCTPEKILALPTRADCVLADSACGTGFRFDSLSAYGIE